MKASKFLLALLVPGLIASANALAWTRSSDFNDGVVGQSTQRGGDFDDAGGGTLYTNEQSLDGSLAAKMSINQGAEGFGSWGGIINFPGALTSGDEVWVQFYIYIPDNFSIVTPGNGSLKFVRIRTATSEGSNGGYNDFQIMDDNTTTNAVYRYIKEGVWDRGWMLIGERAERSQLLPRNRWFKVELAFGLGISPVSEGGNSYVRFWMNDELIWNGTQAQTLSGSNHIADALYMFTYWNGKAPKTQSLYVDNIVMTSDTPTNRDARGYPFIGDQGIGTPSGSTGSNSGGSNPEVTAPPARIEEFFIE